MIETINGKAYVKKGNKVYELGGGGGTTGVNIYTADSEAGLPDPSTVKEGSLGFVPGSSSGGGNVTDSQIDARVEAFWTNADLLDFTNVFDFSESIMQGGAIVEKSLGGDGFNLGVWVIDKMQRGPVKIKVALGGTTSELFVFASNFRQASQVIGFVDNDGHLLYLYILVRADNVLLFQCKEIPTATYVPS